MQEYYVKEGAHSARPLILRYRKRPTRFVIQAQFTDATYLHGNQDQGDWNKLGGLSWHLFNNHINSIMLGWRWNPEISKFEINVYSHIDGDTVYTKPLFSVSAKDYLTGTAYIDYKAKSVSWFLFVNGVQMGEPVIIKFPKKLKRWTREINLWFGGNRKAPRTIKLKKSTM